MADADDTGPDAFRYAETLTHEADLRITRSFSFPPLTGDPLESLHRAARAARRRALHTVIMSDLVVPGSVYLAPCDSDGQIATFGNRTVDDGGPVAALVHPDDMAGLRETFRALGVSVTEGAPR